MTDKPFMDTTSDHYPLARCACSHNLREHQTGKGNCVHCECEAFVRVDEPVIVARCFPKPVVDLHEVLEPILQRPAMYFGTPNITAFFHFYMGLSYLGSISHRPLHIYKLKGDLWEVDGFIDWVNKKHNWSAAVDKAHLYCDEAANQLEDDPEVESFNEYMVEELGFALFVKDYREWRELHP